MTPRDITSLPVNFYGPRDTIRQLRRTSSTPVQEVSFTVPPSAVTLSSGLLRTHFLFLRGTFEKASLKLLPPLVVTESVMVSIMALKFIVVFDDAGLRIELFTQLQRPN